MARIAALALLLVAAAGCDAGSSSPGEPAAGASVAQRAAPTPARLRAAVRTPAVIAHLRRLEAVARRHGGNRAAGTPGGEASIELVASRLRAAGYRVRLQPVPFPFFDERTPPRVVAGAARLRPGRDVRTLGYSAGGRTAGGIVEVRRLGCRRADHDGIGAGDVALVRRGICRFGVKARLAQAAGASAVLVVNDRPGTFAGTLGRPGIRIPVVGTTPEAGRRLADAGRARVVVDAVSERRTTRNVLAETGGAARGTVMVGAHVDSVPEGPGINDDGTGVAAVLEIAEQLGRLRPPRHRIRVAFWGAEELGLYGSRHYVRGLSRVQRRRIAAYVNLDMIGSRNAVRDVYDGADGPPGSARIEQVLRGALEDRAVGETSLRAASDHAPFRRAGIPVGGLFTGAEARKTAGEAARFGGRADRPLDPCYHRACDTLANVDRRILGQMTDAAAAAVAQLAK